MRHHRYPGEGSARRGPCHPGCRLRPDDGRNGILLTATLHRAFDAGLWALNPGSGSIELDPRIKPDDLRLTALQLRAGVPYPHADAMSWRYARFRHRAQSEA
ncbi:HNH endonuclease signature motif containing protein [Cellulomonas fengjieae]|uniref:HNH endonuclease n=1 Tax=Cellulomonas fengjieae TaxID=2819978 RepID=A0ABS3SG70_9CELL|nr:HNH endonuclease [Cellulomonas fengjieae]QVI66932.1 HNH endonuclease [Cellulomonas fengjieae]